MKNYIHMCVKTPYGSASNNHGETVGNRNTLSTLYWEDGLRRAEVSADAIRCAIRYAWHRQGLEQNRQFDEDGGYKTSDIDRKRYQEGERLIDDDVMGFFTEKNGHRKSPFDCTPAISLSPYRAENAFRCCFELKKGDPVPFEIERFGTSFQYGGTLSLKRLNDQGNAEHLLNAIKDLSAVAGGHSRHSYRFSAASIVLYVTDRPDNKVLHCFDFANSKQESGGAERLIALLENGRVDPSEIIVGGEIANTYAEVFSKYGVATFPSSDDAVAEAIRRVGG